MTFPHALEKIISIIAHIVTPVLIISLRDGKLTVNSWSVCLKFSVMTIISNGKLCSF